MWLELEQPLWATHITAWITSKLFYKYPQVHTTSSIWSTEVAWLELEPIIRAAHTPVQRLSICHAPGTWKPYVATQVARVLNCFVWMINFMHLIFFSLHLNSNNLMLFEFFVPLEMTWIMVKKGFSHLPIFYDSVTDNYADLKKKTHFRWNQQWE